jgi:Asp-tRNA(Asn)/Glu-tRNA(Gln) amidotransferase A subunit family amidase
VTPPLVPAESGVPTAAEIAADVRAGRRTARSVTEAALARIAEVDGRLNAFTAARSPACRSR